MLLNPTSQLCKNTTDQYISNDLDSKSCNVC